MLQQAPWLWPIVLPTLTINYNLMFIFIAYGLFLLIIFLSCESLIYLLNFFSMRVIFLFLYRLRTTYLFIVLWFF